MQVVFNTCIQVVILEDKFPTYISKYFFLDKHSENTKNLLENKENFHII